MNLEFVTSDYFGTELKRLAKRYRGLADDYETFLNSLRENPLQGAEIAPNIRKVRMPITAKGRGKSSGARVITYNAIVAEQEGGNIPVAYLRQGGRIERKDECS